MRNLADPLIRRSTRAEAEAEAEKLKAAARRMGYGLEVHGQRRRYGNRWYTDPPYGVYLVPLRKPQNAPQRAQESPGHPPGE